MNKEKFIDCLRDPSLLQDNEIQELNQLVKRYPYFQGARALLAKVSKERNLKEAAHRISSAAVYTTDRALLKKYISDHLFFLDSRDAVKEEKPKPTKAPVQKEAQPPRPPASLKETVKKAPAKPEPSNEKKTPQKPALSSDQKAPPKQGTPKRREVAKPPAAEQPKTTPPKAAPAPKEQSKPAVAKKSAPIKPAPEVEEELSNLQASETNLDDWIKEIHADMAALKESRARFQAMEKKLDEEDQKKEEEEKRLQEENKRKEEEEKKKLEEEEAVNAALKKVTGKKADTKRSATSSKKVSKSQGEYQELKEEDKEAIEKNLPLNAPEEAPKSKTKAKSTKKRATTKKAKDEPVAKKEENEIKTYASLKRSNLEANEEESPDTSKAEEKASEKKTPTKKATGKADPVKEEIEAESKVEEQAPIAEKKPAKKKEVKAEEEDTGTLKVVRRRSGKVKSTTFEVQDKEKSEEESKEKIIDEFISTSPKISKADKSKLASTENKEDLSDKSSRFQADIGTEYLAEIYVEQGKLERAISIYEKLSLKFPEKKSYFVARIEELKSK